MPEIEVQLHSPETRRQLVRFCRRLAGDADAAEDLAQDALLEAWRCRNELRDPAAGRAWLNGIARNMARRWWNQRQRTQSRLVPLETAERTASAEFADDGDLAGQLERAERADLVDRALSVLPAASRALLIARYVESLPPTEIANRLGVSENVAAVRLHRSRDALQRVLATDLRKDAAAYGLLDAETAAGWQETRIWCPICGSARLLARHGDPNADTPASTRFATRCPSCGPAAGMDFTARSATLDPEQVLGDVRAFRPALRRVQSWWNDFFQRAIRTRQAPCVLCGCPASVHLTPPPGTHPYFVRIRGVYFSCTACGGSGCVSPHGLVLMQPAGQRFWQQHARVRLCPAREIRLDNGEAAVVIRLESVSGKSALEVVTQRRTMQAIQVREEK